MQIEGLLKIATSLSFLIPVDIEMNEFAFTKPNSSQCLKISKKVSFHNIASESDLRLQKFIKKAKNGQFGEFLKNWSLQTNSVTRQVNFKQTKLVENANANV